MHADRLSKLTESQRAYLRLVLAHNSSKQIAQHFGISAHTVDKRLKEAMKILGVTSRVDAARILECAEAENRVRDLGPQSSDLENLARPGSVTVRSEQGYGYRKMAAATIREDQQIYPDQADGQPFPLPFPTRRKRHNDLTILQRLAWTMALIIGLAVATGILLSGLTNLSILITELSR